MSDVLHHARPTSTESAAAFQRNRFRARIEAGAARLHEMPIQQQASPSVVPAEVQEPITVIAGPERTTIDYIQRTVAAKYGMTKAEMKCSARLAPMVRVRHIAMYVVRIVTKQSYPVIGSRFGYRDHSTAIHACRKMERLRLSDAVLDAELADLIAQFSQT